MAGLRPRAGHLTVGENSRGEVVVCHPDLKPDKDGVGHIVFSPQQALDFAALVRKHAGADKLWELVSEDLTHLGGPMGTEYATEIFRRKFYTLEGAKRFAQEDYSGEIEWKRDRKGWTSGDMGHVMYEIRPAVPEKILP